MMTTLRLPPLLAVLVTLAACGGGQSGESADAFVARTNEELRVLTEETAAARWVAQTYITKDTELLAAKAEERRLEYVARAAKQARRYDGAAMSPASARALRLLRLAVDAPAPDDAVRRAELATITTRMTSAYGAGRYCPGGPETCRNLDELSKTLATSRDWDEQLEAWRGWHTIAPPLRADYQRFVELANDGARELGYADLGEMWRAGYDMDPAELVTEVERLWTQVKPLYDRLHCYARGRLQQKYGRERVPDGRPIPAHILGNMWAQQWNNIYDLLEPYPGISSLDVSAALEAQRYDAVRMTRSAESFYASLGFPALPETFWERSMLVRPRDREVVCHASAWQMDSIGDVRIKQCIQPTEEELLTIYHELGHVYYYLMYLDQPTLFQTGAHDGFHEAVGDAVVLSMTEDYLAGAGLLPARRSRSREALINNQMRVAAERIAFLPFGMLVDQWRWGVFSGATPPEKYNESWWELRRRYQGIEPADRAQRGRLRPGGQVPHPRQHALPALFPGLRAAVPVPRDAVRGSRPPGSAARVLDPRQPRGRTPLHGHARARRQPALAGCAGKTDRRAADGCLGHHRIFPAADGLARGTEPRPPVRLVS